MRRGKWPEQTSRSGSSAEMYSLLLRNSDADESEEEEVGDSPSPQLSRGSKETRGKYGGVLLWSQLKRPGMVMAATFCVVCLVVLLVALAASSRPASRVLRQQPDWWQRYPVYQIYPRSFKDTNGDGVGDLAGIRSKLDYLSDIGAKTVWLSPIFQSPMKDFGYDISDFRAIDPVFGTMEDFEALVRDVKEREMHLVLDLVPNHSSDQHDWFQRSVRREANYTDYYVWADGRGGGPPNAWVSRFGGPAWTYVAERDQWYYHQFLAQQPDLNFRNPAVVKEMQDVLRFWLDKGVDGFRLDAMKYLLETRNLSAVEPLLKGRTNGRLWRNLDHLGITMDHQDTLHVLAGWRRVCDQYKTRDGRHRLLMAEVYGDTSIVMRYYGNGTNMADFPFNFLLVRQLRSPAKLSGVALQSVVDEWRSNQPNHTWADWILGSHDVPRVASRVGEPAVDALNMLVLLLPGTPVTYYGEELGMSNTLVRQEQSRDTAGRDPYRTPMQWSAAGGAGFTHVQPWLPINPNHVVVNVASQLKAERSHLKVYKKLLKLRLSSVALLTGSYTELIADKNTFAFMRLRDGALGFVIVINTAEQTRSVNLTGLSAEIPPQAIVEVRGSLETNDVTVPGSSVSLETVPLGPRQGVVLSFQPVP